MKMNKNRSIDPQEEKLKNIIDNVKEPDQNLQQIYEWIKRIFKW